MRIPARLVLGLALGPPLVLPLGTVLAAPDVAALERAWTTCVRDSFAEQPALQGKAGAQRNALDACKEREDAYVAALMAERAGGDGNRTIVARAREWASSMAAYVVDPVSSWIAMLRR
ncbi:hypothetical protein ASG60_02950 [Methylobacterium sp. Leaf469]|jgi:hypothetical protein|uniref:hypothetical protein n=1 Tax=unclassified Methylobacterium TaxID=2615210 RepID=UPI0006FADDDB|nr:MULTISPECIES: hypothetical protein [unclassified Methylobacterium]KQO65993.1 hypothetical protein ASF22_04805 [Methylobacterium sp. Leaf87]KQP18827.1 hypothetical protein ASF25_10370 [Methylobacterium sp. Leaf100]KQP34555.1 hypothetical protein ASF27_03175 [Methylobacterium sp. Leaf102]KQP72087.1 hypothetical protein ASF52_00685 [Methylobacterium sp. Leaf112]KQU05631.1 hypothetical protein ASG60_02950 [Methylobacterium sp. Leaf469]